MPDEPDPSGMVSYYFRFRLIDLGLFFGLSLVLFLNLYAFLGSNNGGNCRFAQTFVALLVGLAFLYGVNESGGLFYLGLQCSNPAISLGKGADLEGVLGSANCDMEVDCAIFRNFLSFGL